ncbi:hypothetical protein HDV63DRAFT_405047 [Trichoderma sp. SZMC 28014]
MGSVSAEASGQRFHDAALVYLSARTGHCPTKTPQCLLVPAASSLAQRSHLSVALARLLVVLGTGSSPVIWTRPITNVVASQPGAALAQRRGAAKLWKPAGGC